MEERTYFALHFDLKNFFMIRQEKNGILGSMPDLFGISNTIILISLFLLWYTDKKMYSETAACFSIL